MEYIVPFIVNIIPMIILICIMIDLIIRKPQIVNPGIVIASIIGFILWFLGEYFIAIMPEEYALSIARYLVFPIAFFLCGTGLHICLNISRVDRKLPVWGVILLSYSLFILAILAIIFQKTGQLITGMEQKGIWKVELFGKGMMFFQIPSTISALVDISLLVYGFLCAKTKRDKKLFIFWLIGFGILAAWVMIWSVWKTITLNKNSFPPNMEYYGSVLFVFVLYRSLVKYGVMPYFTKRYKMLFDINPTSIVLLDEMGVIRDFNPNFKDMVGFKGESLVGKPFFRLVHFNSVEDANAQFCSFFKKGTVLRDMYYEITNLLGETKHIIVKSGFVEVEKELMAIYIMDDITERKRTEEALRLSEIRYKDFFENTPVMILALDNNYKIINANPYLLYTLKYSLEEVIGKHFLEIVAMESGEIIGQELMVRLKENNTVIDAELQIIAKDNRKVEGLLNVRKIEAAEGQKEVIYITIRDITERKYAERMLIERERLATLGELTAGIAHNMKTPLMSCAGGIFVIKNSTMKIDQLLKQKNIYDEDNKYIELVNEMYLWEDRIREHLTYMSDVINTVREQTVEGTEDSFTLKELTRKTFILMEYELKKNKCTIEKRIEVDLDTEVKGSINSLVQVLGNVISNAIHAYEDKSGKIELNITKGKGCLTFAVRDYGKGIPDNIKNKLFKDMVTTKGKDGTGLGLYISNTVVMGRFGGNMRIESEINNGTIVYISIPIERGSI